MFVDDFMYEIKTLRRGDDLVILRDKQCIDIFKAADIFQTFFQAEEIAVGAERISLHGGFGEDRDAEKVILDRITCCRIKDVMIDRPVFFSFVIHKIALITAGRDDRSVTFLDRGDDLVCGAKGFLYTDVEG